MQTLHNSQDAGKKNLLTDPGRDSPRRVLKNMHQRVDAPDTDKIGHGGGIYPARSPGIDGSPRALANAELPRGKPYRSSGSKGVADEKTVRNPSKDKCDGPDAGGRLAIIAFLGNAERGPRE